MKNFIKPFIIIVALFLTSTILGQQKIYEKISEAKSNKASFKTINVFSKSEADINEVIESRTFENIDQVTLLDYNLNPKELQETYISIQIPLDGIIQTLDLYQVEEKFYSYKVVLNKKENYDNTNRNSKHYRGIVRNLEKNSTVSLSFFENDVKGVISTSKGNYNIGRLKNINQYIIYNDRNLIENLDFKCSIANDYFIDYAPEVLDGTAISADAFATNCVKFYFETEYDIYTTLSSSIINVENYVTALYNEVATLYYNEGIDTTISEINIWTTTDPYTSTNTAGLLTQFQNNINTMNGDLGQLLTFRNIGGGRAAGFSGLCNVDVDESLSVSGGLNSTITTVPTYSWEVMVVTHEFGHLFGLRHTHACVWNGNNSAIDGCSGFTEGSCSVPGSPATGGTIMSYCHADPVGINFTNGFGPQPGNVMRANVANATCLTDCDNCVASGANFDLYMKDQPSDTGVEPNPNGITWQSQDMWIRQDLDGGTTHQNAEYKALSPNGVYVRVRNLGIQTSTCATLKVYWTKASAGLMWPANFINFFQNVSSSPVLHGDIVGTAQIPSIAPGSSTIIELPWYPPNPADFDSDVNHFCLAARIISADDPMANEVVGRIEPNAQNNNNIIQKNIAVHDLNTNNLPISVYFRGVNKNTKFINVLFTDKGFQDDKVELPFFERGGTVEVTIDEKYFRLMLENHSLEGEGIKIIDENKVLLYSNNAAFNKIPLSFGESFRMDYTFNLEKINTNEEVIFDVLQQNAEERSIEGGERFVIIKPLESDEKVEDVNGKENFIVFPNPNEGVFTIHLSEIKKAEYSIYNSYGFLVKTGALTSEITTINLGKILNGIYHIKVTSGTSILKQSFIKK